MWLNATPIEPVDIAVAKLQTRMAAATVPRNILPLKLSGVGYNVRGRELLRDVNITFCAAGSSIVLGPNGAGKSLLLRLCHGLIQPTRGVVEWHDAAAVKNRRHQAMVLQRPVMLRRSVAANIEYPLRLNNVPKTQRRQMLRQALEMAGLLTLADRNARVLSGGEQQRVALARAWVLHPQVLFLDEPTANLDPSGTCAVEEIALRFKAAGAKIIMTTHDLGQARRMADEVIFLHNGRVLEISPASDFFSQPRTPEAQAYLRGELIY